MRHWLIRSAAAALIAAVVVAVLIVVVADRRPATNDGDDARPLESVGTGPARDLLELLAKGRELEPLYARYEQRGGGVTIERWRLGDRSREDITESQGDAKAHLAVFSGPEQPDLACTERHDGEWSCFQTEHAQVSVEAALLTAQAELRGAAVQQHPQELFGRAADCFAVTLEGADLRICLTSDGLALRVERDEFMLDLVATGTVVDQTTFVPPAAPGIGVP